jgi:hypothetical protein
MAPQILRELQGDFRGDWAVEAAGLLADPRFLPALKELDQRITGEQASGLTDYRTKAVSLRCSCSAQAAGPRAEDS